MSPAERLLAKITAAGVPLPGVVEFQRTYAGAWQRRQGAWAWQLVDATTGHPVGVGSQHPRSALTGRIAATRTPYGEWEIDPWEFVHGKA